MATKLPNLPWFNLGRLLILQFLFQVKIILGRLAMPEDRVHFLAIEADVFQQIRVKLQQFVEIELAPVLIQAKIEFAFLPLWSLAE